MCFIIATFDPTSSPLKGIKEGSMSDDQYLVKTQRNRPNRATHLASSSSFLRHTTSTDPRILKSPYPSAFFSISLLHRNEAFSLFPHLHPLYRPRRLRHFCRIRRHGLPRLVHRRNPRLRSASLRTDHREGSLREWRVRRGIAVECWGLLHSPQFIYISMSALSHDNIGGTSTGPVAPRTFSCSISICRLLVRIFNTIKHI